MEISNYRNQFASLAVVLITSGFYILSFLWLSIEKRWPPSQEIVYIFILLGVFALALCLGLRVSLRLYAEQGALQWSYRLFGNQLSSKVIPLDQVLATGLRYWRTKEVNYQPVLALKNGKLLPVGKTSKAWSLTGGGDLETYREAKCQADAVAKALGVESLAKSPDSCISVVEGSVQEVSNKRETDVAVSTIALLVGLCIMVFAVVFGPFLAR